MNITRITKHFYPRNLLARDDTEISISLFSKDFTLKEAVLNLTVNWDSLRTE